MRTNNVSQFENFYVRHKAEGLPKNMPVKALMEKDKLLDYMFDQNSKLTDQISGVREDLRIQREQVDRHHSDLKASLDRMEERAVTAETICHTLMLTVKQMKGSVSEYFDKLFAKIVRGCTDMASMLPMNIGLSANKY